MEEKKNNNQESCNNYLISEKFLTICIGIALITFNIDFWILKSVTTAIGYMLLFSGFFALKDENPQYHKCYKITIALVLFQIAGIGCNCTSLLYNLTVLWIFVIINTVIKLMLLINFGNALESSFVSLNHELDVYPFKNIYIAMVISFLAILFEMSNWIVFIIIAVLYIQSLKKLYNCGLELDNIGYGYIKETSLADRNRILLGFAALCVILVIICSVFSNHYEAKGETYTINNTQDRQKLQSMGIPDDILNDMSDEAVAQISDASKIDVHEDKYLYEFDFGNYRNTSFNLIDSDSDLSEGEFLKLATIYAETEDNKLYILHHFKWINKSVNYQEGFKIYATNGYPTTLNIVDAKLLYSRNDNSYIADFPKIEHDYSSDSVFSLNMQHLINGAFSFPYLSKDNRGYIMYYIDIDKPDNFTGCLADSFFQYMHMFNPISTTYKDSSKYSPSDNDRNILYYQYHTEYNIE